MSEGLKKKESSQTLKKQAPVKSDKTPQTQQQQQQTLITDPQAQTQTQQHSHRRTLLRSVKNLFIKTSLNLSLAAAKLRSLADDVLSSDEVVNELFLVTSSSTVDSSLLEQEGEQNNITKNNTEVQSPSSTRADSQSDNMTVDKQKTNASSLPLFQEFDTVAEADALRKENEPFVDGDKVWEKRRKVWLNATGDEKLQAKQKALENTLSGVSKENYPIIYTNLVEKQKTLKKPMNLKDALKVINAGWVATKKWERASQGLA